MQKFSTIGKKLVWLLLAVMMIVTLGACTREIDGYDTVLFGHFEQDGKLENGSEDLEWVILEKTDEYAVLATKYGVFAKDYFIGSAKKDTVVSWSTSSLRRWMIQTFYEQTFNDEEKELIIPQTFQDEVTGKNVTDYATLLTVEEVSKYFPTRNSRLLQETQYAKASKAYRNTLTQSGWWWLRDMGRKEASAAYVNSLGSIKTNGNYANYSHALVRPVIRVKLEVLE